ncbi:MAG: carboxypeptidase regulatory-like domain-containing protein, partial [Planctomycetota bacterium]
LVDAESGIALAGVEMKASVSITKGALFFKRNERLEATVVTDAEGRFEMPGDDGGKVVEGSHYGAIAAQHEGLLTVSCRATLDEGDGILLHPEVDFACRVRLATPLSADERAAASYGIAIADPDGNREGIRVRYRPAVALDDELLLLAPRYALRGDWDEGRTSGTITIATTPNGPTFAVTFDALPSLLDQPLLAEVSDTVIHTVRVVDAATGDAVPSAHVSVFPTGGRYAWLAPFTGGASDETGEAELIGVPQGECSVSIQKLGYVRKRSTLTAVAGGTTEVLLEPEAALRTVQIEVRSARGAGEPHVWIVVSRSDGMHAARAAVYAERDGDGWVARATLDTVPSERCFVELQGPSQAHDLQRHWILEADENELVIDVGPARDVQQVFIDAPEGVEFEYTQSIGPARRSVSEHVGPGIVRSAPVDGTPVSWTVRAEGYVPVVGTEADWTPAEVDGRAVVRLDAPFRRGWGEVVYVYSIGPADDGRGGELPFGMRAQVPAEGVTLLDGPEGRVIGVTNERGLAVIEGDERPAAIWYRHGGVIRKRRVLDGEESLHVLLR